MAEMPEKEIILTALKEGDLELEGQFTAGSNYTFLGKLVFQELELRAVYKPVRGEQPLWDFPPRSLSKREVAAYVLSEGLGWNLVPPTVYRRKGRFGPGSLQLFVDHDPNYHFFNFDETDRQRLRPAAVFDLITNNADRKGGHIILDENRHIWLIDHGICFNVEDKLRTVIWHFAGEPVPAELLKNLEQLVQQLDDKENLLTSALRDLLKPSEVRAIAHRARQLLETGVFPYPSTQRPFPWPPV
jgi:uncharacterized repeat protein (TIGR03843 family)